MIARCDKSHHPSYRHYGGRGIDVCERWRGIEGYFRFSSDMGEPPCGMELDRIDNDSGYSPENCRWTNHVRQMRNTRRTMMVTYQGETLPLRDLAERFGMKPHTLRGRLVDLKWSLEKSLTKPVQISRVTKVHNTTKPRGSE
jgi:hypothetical protein